MAKKKRWERCLPNPPCKCDVLRSIILQHIKWFEARPIFTIHRCVLDDYGSITDRTIYRHLAVLVKEGEIVRVQDDQEDTWGYVRARRPAWSDVEQVYV